MIKLDERSFQEDFQKIKLWLSHAQKEIPFAMAFTLTKMGQAGKAGVTKNLPKIFKNPTPWTMKSIFLQAATKTNLVAVVYIKDGSRSSLLHHIQGGKRPEKGYEYNMRRTGILKGSNQYTVPAKRMRLNKYGNLTMGLINKISSSVGAQLDPLANTTRNSLKRNASQGNYFLVKRSDGTPSGIYETKGSGSNQTLQPVLIFVKSPTYRRRFPFHEIVSDDGYDAMDQAIEDVLKYVFSK
jgi:hypothetical protein